jgi:predicted phage terminase large subunit-like protein
MSAVSAEYNSKDRRTIERLKLQVEAARVENEYRSRIESESLVLARNFKEFVAEAWNVYRPNTPMKMNWHHEYIIELLQGVEEGEFPGQWLLINVPPRCTKSSLVMVLFPAWCWTHNPYKQFACFSHSQDFARRDSRETRRLIRSPWFVERWGGNVEPASDGDQVDKFVNIHGGQRICYGITQNFVGVNADLILNDDLNDPKSLSEAKRETVAEAIRSGVVTRFNDFARGSGISIQQRVHLEDATGVLQELYKSDAHVIKIPMRFEGQKFICPTLQLEDPRTEVGSLLWPDHIPEKSVRTLERSLGEWGTAAQLQQEPIPTGGGLVKERDFRIWKNPEELPEFEYTILSLDPAFSERDFGKGDAFNPQRSQSAFTYWGAFRYTDPETNEDRDAVLLIDSLADWMGFPELRKESARLYKKHDPDTFLVENKAAGISLIQDFARAGIYITPFNPMKMDKIARFMLVVPYIQEGSVFFIDNIQNRNTISQLCTFPKAKYNDRVDSTAQALLFLLRMGLNYLPEDEEEEDEENARFSQMNSRVSTSRLPWSY